MGMSGLIAIICILACSLETRVDAFYIGDPATYAKMVETFGAQQFDQVNNSDFIILATGYGITGKVASNSQFRVLQLLDLLAPAFVTRLENGTEDFQTDTDHPLNFLIDNFTVNTDTNEFDIGTGSYDNIEVIPSFLSLRNLTVMVRVGIDIDASSFSERFQLRGLAVAGIWRLASVGGFAFKFSKYGAQWYFRGAPESGSIPIGSFAQDIAAAILPAGGLQDSLQNAGLDSFTIEKARFVGAMNRDGFAIGLSGNPTIQGWGSFRGHVMVHRYAKEPWQQQRTVVTIGIVFPSFQLSDLLQRIANIDITDIPFLGTLTVPEIGLVISTGTVDPNLLPEVLDGILTNANPVTKGVIIVIAIPILQGQPAVQFIAHLGPNDIRFSIVDPGATLTLTNLLSLIIPDFDASTLTLPPGISDLLNVQLYGFQYQHQTKSIAVELKFGDELVLIPDVVSILNPTLFLNVTLKSPRKTRVSASGAWTLGSARFPVELVPASAAPVSNVQQPVNGPAPVSQGFILRASFDDIDIGDIISALNVDFLPSELQAVLAQASLLDFSIIDPFIAIPIGTGSGGFLMQLSGRPQIGGWSGVTLNLVVSKTTGSFALAVGFEFANFGLADLIEQLIGVNVRVISLLDQTLKVAIVVSPRAIPGVRLQGEILSQIQIVKGLSIVGLFSFPSDCAGEQFCEFMKGVLGSSASLQLRTTISGLTDFTFAASVNNIELGAGITLSEAGLEIKFGIENSIGLVASLQLTDPPILLKGSIRVGTQGLELQMKMVGIWKMAFTIEWLAFGNAILSISLKPGVPVPGLAIGGELCLGKLDTGNEIIIAIYVGIDTVNPTRNYFYGSVNNATLAALMAAFEFTLDLPTVLTESGFPEGLLVSYSLIQIEVPGRTIQAGFRLNGTLNILGFTVSCDIIIDVPRRIKIDIHMSPLNLAGGLLRLYRSSGNPSQGPMFFADIKILPFPSVDVRASGYASVAGVLEAEAFMVINNTKMILEITGDFFLFAATLRVYANYGSLQEASFRVYGSLSTAWLQNIETQVETAIDEAQQTATSQLTDAKRNVANARGSFDDAIRTLQDAQREVQNANSKFDAAIRSLQDKQNKVNRLCSIRRCHGICMGCATWRSCCRRWWGRCIGCAGWNGCCWRARNLVCEAINLGCKGLRALAYVALELAKKVVDGSRWTLDLARGALRFAEGVVDGSRSSLDIAIAFLGDLQVTASAALDAADWIAKFALGGVINIRLIEFDIEIGLVSSGHFMGRLEVSFLGGDFQTIRFDLRLQSVQDMVLDLIDKIFPGISGRSRRDVAYRMKRSFPDFSRSHYFPETYRPGSYRDEKRQVVRKTTAKAAQFSVEQVTYLHTWKRRRNSDNDSSTADAAYDNTTANYTVANNALLAAANRSEAEYNALLLQINFTDSEENKGSDPANVVLSAVNLTMLANMSTDYMPVEDNTQPSLDYSIPAITTCPLDGSLNTPCAVPRDLTQLLFDIADVIQYEYKNWTGSVTDYSTLATSIENDYGEVTSLQNDSAVEMADVEQTKLQLNSLNNTGSTLTQEEEMRVDQRLSSERSYMNAIDNVTNNLLMLNKTARRHLVEQNANIMRVINNTIYHQVLSQTTRSYDEYLNLLFSCMETPYRTQSQNQATQEVLQIMGSLHEKFGGVFDKTLSGAKKVADDIQREMKILMDRQVLC